MLGTHDLLLFVISGLLLNVTPGPDTLYIVGRSSTQGLRAGTVAALGIGAGTLIHITAAALGLSALLAASAMAFSVVKWAGAIYLVYVGLSLLRSAAAAPQPGRASALAPASLRTVFLQGFLTNVLNPKVALFFLAFLPQFVAPDADSRVLAFLFLGAIFDVNGTLWNLFVAWSAARAAGGLRRSAAFTRWLNRGVGALFVYLGIRLAFAREG
jgi:threonine/homoserine/homoserine lactone efflux protein